MTSDNSLKKSNKANRKEIFLKLAKKDTNLSGKLNRKSIEKTLSKATELYNKSKALLDDAKDEKAKLDKIIEEETGKLKSYRKDIMNCHDYLKNMDFSGAKELKVDNDDVAYVFDGKPFHYDFETGEKKPYGQWKREQRMANEPVQEVNDVQDENAVLDENDVNDPLKNLDPDGVDITI